MRFRHILTAAAALAVVQAAPASAVVIDLDGVDNASTDGWNAATLSLAAGTYTLRFVEGAFTAFNRFSTTSLCDDSGMNCRQGWENSARFIVDGGPVQLFGDGAGSGGYGPLDPGDGYFETAELSFANSGVYSTSFTLANPGDVSFFIYDGNNQLRDNTGGVSLDVAAVPEPATWALMILGFGAIAGGLRRRRYGERMTFA